jgi:hypothetical protein
MNKNFILKPKPKQAETPKELVMSEELKEATKMYVFKQVIPILSIHPCSYIANPGEV